MSPSLSPNERRDAALQWEIDNRKAYNRALGSSGLCCYDHAVMGGCAIGRLLPEEIAKAIPNRLCRVIFDQLPGDIKNMGVEFLIALQSLHDDAANWDNFGLTQTGLVEARKITQSFRLTIDFSKYGSQQ